MSPRTLSIEVVDIQGHCPVYEIGDRFHIVDGYKLVTEIPLCMHALQSLAPYYVALVRNFAQLGVLRMVCDDAKAGRKCAAEIAPHAEVVADVDEVLSASMTWEATDAKLGTLGRVMVFPYEAEWEGQFYQEKEVTVQSDR